MTQNGQQALKSDPIPVIVQPRLSQAVNSMEVKHAVAPNSSLTTQFQAQMKQLLQEFDRMQKHGV